MSREDYRVGQEVQVHSAWLARDPHPRVGVIVKVARVRATVEVQGVTYAFNMDTGYDHSDPPTIRVYTDEQIAERDARAAAVNRLGRLGLTFKHGPIPDAATVNAVCDLIEERRS